ncbi:MAG: hypothetical protein JXB26_09230 [Candidatus Aminicenantes bacterium]|nr:hypothetical protein [Candidatus Aminicenantes bacterium]
MIRKKEVPAALWLFLFSCGAALFINLYLELNRLSISDHSFPFNPWIFFPVLAFMFVLLIFIRKGLLRIFFSGEGRPSFKGMAPILPLGLLWTAPFLLANYITRQDLRCRLHVLGASAILTSLALFLHRRFREKGSFSFLKKWEKWFSALSLRKKLVLLFAAAFIIYQLCTLVLIWKGRTFSGDEPYYLLSTHSLLKDGDLNVRNNYLEKDYFFFYDREKSPNLTLQPYAREGKKGGSFWYPINMPGISVLMIPAYALAQYAKGNLMVFLLKGSLSLWAVFLGLQLFLFARELWFNERTAFMLWFLYAFTAPVLFYAVHLYPEIPIALFSLYVFRKAHSKKSLGLGHYLLMGFLLALFPWFGLKYNLIMGAVILAALYLLWTQHRARVRLLAFLAPPLISMGFFYLYVFHLYGTFSPFAIYEGVLTPDKAQSFRQVVLSIPVMLRLETLLDYFLDQRDGLLLYAPLYFFSFLGFIELFRRKKRDFFLFGMIVLPFILNYALLSHRQGFSPQGRVLCPLTWIGMIGVGYFWVYNRKRIFKNVFIVCCILSLTAVVLLLLQPTFLYQPTTHEHTARPGDMFVHLSSIKTFLPHFLPSFIKIDNSGYWPNYIWIFILGGVVAFYAFQKKERLSGRFWRPAVVCLLLAVVFTLWVIYPGTSLYPTRVVRYSPQRALGFYMFPMGKGVVAKNEGDFYLHYDKTYTMLFSSRKPLENITLEFGSEKGEFDIEMEFFDLPLYRGKTDHEIREINFTPEAFYPLKKLCLYQINISLKQLSDELLLRHPFYLRIIP